METELFIGGTWRASGDGATAEVTDPATGETIATVADATAADGIAAVAAAAAAQPAWAALAPRRRAEVLRAVFDGMVAATDDLAELITRENGKPVAEARGEVTYAAEFFRWFSEEAVRLDGQWTPAPGGGKRIMVTHQPIGVALLITPWNFPAAMATRKIAPALAAGCAMVLKPAMATPLTALALGPILEAAGVPDGVVNILPTTRSPEFVGAVLAERAVRKMSFTGSTEVGRILLAQAAERVVSCSMELGGNAPFLVFADADLDAAVDGAMIAKMRHNGETCTAANRFYVEAPVADEFARRLAERMGSLRLGHGIDPSTELGPLVDAATRDKVSRLVSGAVAEGAELLCGGKPVEGPGFFYPPTVLVGVAPDACILAEEIFGPVAPVVAFTDEADVIRWANDTEHGLVSYVFSGDLGRGLRVAEAIESGMVGLNTGLVSDPAAPFGGMKQSGVGREGGHYGIFEFTETKYIAIAF